MIAVVIFQFVLFDQPDPVTADADDDFGFGIVDEDFTDMKKRNPTSGADETIT